MTPTEAAAVAAVYAYLISLLLYRNISLRLTPIMPILAAPAPTASIGMLIAGALVFNYVVTVEQHPADRAAACCARYELSQTTFLIAVNVILLVLGCLLEGSTILLVILPIFIPTAKALGHRPRPLRCRRASFNIMIGLITPPYGLLLFIVAALSGVPLRISMHPGTMPFVIAMVIALAIITFVPETVLWLPRVMGYKG